MQRVDGAAELARKLVVGLRQRGWDGDDELADQLEAHLGSGPAAMLRALPVDLEELAGILEGDPLSIGGRIDITTGEVWSQAAIEYVLETGEEDEDTSDDPERWLAVHGEGSREGYRDMELFIASVEDPGRAERLAVAIKGRGAFRRFKDELACWPGELERWHALSEERQHGRARSWLAASGYRVLPGRPPRFLRTGHRRATSLSEAHLQAAQRDAGHTLGREAEGILQSLLFHRASRGLRAQRATFRVLAERDADVDATLASAVGCSPPPRSLTPPRPPLSDQRARATRLPRCPDCPEAVTRRARSGPRITAAFATGAGAPRIGMSLVLLGGFASDAAAEFCLAPVGSAP